MVSYSLKSFRSEGGLAVDDIDVEEDVGVWWDWAGSFLSISHARWAGNRSGLTDVHLEESIVEAWDDFTGTDLELHWLSKEALISGIENGTISEFTGISDLGGVAYSAGAWRSLGKFIDFNLVLGTLHLLSVGLTKTNILHNGITAYLERLSYTKSKGQNCKFHFFNILLINELK